MDFLIGHAEAQQV